jgi:hypothetical protein
MKKLFIPAIFLIGLASCGKPAPVADTVSEQNKSLVQEYIDAIVKGDTANLESFLADKFMNYGPAIKDSSNRQQEVDGFKKNWRDSWAAVNFDQAAIHGFTLGPGEKNPGDWVAVWAHVTINYKKASPSVNFRWHSVYRVKENKIDLSIVFFDVKDIQVQQGFTFTPPKSKEGAKKEGAKKKEIKKKGAKKKPAKKK